MTVAILAMVRKLGSCATIRQTSSRQAYQQPEKLVTMPMPADWLIVCDWSSPYATFQGLAGVSAQLHVCLYMVSMQSGAGVFERTAE